jgi:hypothetical protein
MPLPWIAALIGAALRGAAEENGKQAVAKSKKKRRPKAAKAMKKPTGSILTVLLFMALARVAGYGQDTPFPADDEINLVVSQTNAAMVQ